MTEGKIKVLVGTAIWNEGEKFKTMAGRMKEFLAARRADPDLEYIFLVVDDGSTDGMPEAFAQDPDIVWRRHGQNRGAGASVRTIYQTAREMDAPIAVTIAGNNKDDPEEIGKLIAPILEDRADFVQGSRYLSGGGHARMPVYRVIGTRIIHPGLMSLFTGRRVTDSTNGFRAVRVSILDDPRLHLNQAWLDRYELESYIYYKSLVLGRRVLEVPVKKIYPERGLSYTKIQPLFGWWSILRALFFLRFGIKK